MSLFLGRGSASKQQADLKKMRMADLASGGGDHKLMAREQANALGNMCNMQVCNFICILNRVFLLIIRIYFSGALVRWMCGSVLSNHLMK